MKSGLVFLALLNFTHIANATDVTIYRWVDEKNIVHFSQNQPEHDNYTELTISKATPHQKNDLPKENKAQAKKLSLDKNEMNKEKCLTAQTNLSTLESFDVIQYKTEAGESKVLSDKQKNDQLVLNKKQVDLYCNDQ